MKVLILTCNTGEGHNSAAAAISQEMNRQQISCDTADALSFISERLSKIVCACHKHVYRHIPQAFRAGYGYSEKHEALFSDHSVIYRALASGTDNLRDFVEAGEYDLLICVHVFSALMASELQRRCELPVKTMFISTDYTCSPSMAESQMDLYCIGHRDLAQEYAENGVDPARLYASGIPVRREFTQPQDRSGARQALELPADGKSLLIMGGSMGAGPVEELTLKLLEQRPEDCDLTVICGNNGRLFEKMNNLEVRGLRVLSFTRQIPLLMAASDLFITKPGGLSISEAAACHLPLLCMDVVGGCELRNLDFFKARDWADSRPDTAELTRTAISWLTDPDILAQKKQQLERDFKVSASERIVSAAKELTAGRLSTLAEIQQLRLAEEH
ncbi:hypothetical protein HCH52_05800 [Oscillospiraceae bacterium HV4-5-C5C]|nr:hypothetical protein [Oscillospiraceae bacterium HV4-5-C5C]